MMKIDKKAPTSDRLVTDAYLTPCNLHKIIILHLKQFLKGTNNGIPDYFFTVGDSTHVDGGKVQWAKYMNPFGAKFFTAEEYEEMLKKQAELFQQNIPYLNRLSTPYSIIYKQMHPEYNGEKMFCEYPGGPLYTADEIMEVMNRNAQDAEYQAKARETA